MFGSLWSFIAVFLMLFITISMAAPVPNTERPDDFRYPENFEDIDNMPMATVRPSVNPCN
ncbi:hypothetical protein CAEBREN_04541 [Caenorhabditis brenneri]|uniref:Uncharacterized protein n=1 Tax=Caenorhabditis brenneri TaxID=135651 RepID=G0N1U0_CAEBE|nr:hypothetical protein CAEBREN_04541 [Caenorhabditis brenneri]